MRTPLEGLKVIEFCTSLPNAQTGQILADFGAEVIQIEPPGGTPLRSQAGYPLWGRGKRSIELDLQDPEDLAAAHRLIADADVVLMAFRPGVAEAKGLGYEELAAPNPRLVYSSITGWGTEGPYADVVGYEPLIMAKIGALHGYGRMVERDGPAYLSVPYASWGAAMSALQGVFAALYERETSGVGQRVEANLALAAAALDPWTQMVHHMTERYPDAFEPAPAFDKSLEPTSGFSLKLLVALTSDGHWLQFSQVQPRLFRAFMDNLDLGWMFDHPEWQGVPDFTDRKKILELNFIMLEAVRTKTLAQWQRIFDDDPNVFAEIYRQGTELLHHPQIVHDNFAITVDDVVHGKTLQPAPLVRFSRSLTNIPDSAPARDADREELLRRPSPEAPETDERPNAPRSLPLADVTILELGSFYAGPYGATLLTDLGARVIKVEELGGDPMRVMQPFPETGAAKVLQGKESVAVDIATDGGRRIVEDLARQADLVLCSFRAGVSTRLGLDADALLAINPDLIYLNSPGFGIDGPYGHRPAFAPTISAGSGIARRNMMNLASPEKLSIPEVRIASVRLNAAANSAGTQPDGIAAMAVGAALTLAAYMRARGDGGQELMSTMLHSAAHALSEGMIEHEGCAGPPVPDDEGYGLHARYRLYQASDGWVFLAAPKDSEWPTLVKALSPHVDLSHLRMDVDGSAHEAELATLLSQIFSRRPAAEWETDLLAAGIGCVVSEETTMEAAFMGDFGRQSGFLVDTYSPIFDIYPRVGPMVQFSRSTTQALGGCTIGQHTDAVLRELGYDAARIADLREQAVIG